MNIDIRTLALVLGLTSILQVIVLYLQFHLNKTYRGIGWWLMWSASTAAGFICMLLRDVIPAGLVSVSILFTNVLLLAGLVFLYTGIMRFLVKQERRGIIFAVFSLFMLSTLYVLYVNYDSTSRTLIFYVACAIFILLAAHALFINKVRSFTSSANFLCAVLFIYGCYYVLRSVAAVTVSPIDSVFTPTLIQTASFLVSLIAGSLCTFGLIIMVSQRSNAEMSEASEAMRESEAKYRLVVENAHESILIAVDGINKFANSKITELTGYSQEEITSGPFIEFVHPDDRQMVVERYRRRLKGEDIPKIYSFRIVDKLGNIKWVELSASTITWEGKPATLNFVSDITGRKRLEEEQQKVEKLESIGTLAGGIAHNFNNILAVILGNISLAGMEAAPGSELQKSLEQAEMASIRAKDLTLQLLTFSKGGGPVKALGSLTELLKDTTISALGDSNVKCKFSIPDGLWQAEIDTRQVNQVIYNLVLNARQSMPKGGTIEVRAENMALNKTQDPGKGMPLRAGDYIRIAVTDHGSGIPQEHLEKIFDPFFTTKINAHGLGVPTSFSIARQHGGHLSVESEVGSGSTFYLYLPASAPKQAEKKAVKAAGKARILVMDDEVGVRVIAGRVLKHIGYDDVEFAGEGAEAIELYKASMKSGNPFSVAILDLTIPGGRGGEWAIRELLKIDPGVKAIVSSGYADESVIVRYSEYGFSGMIAKPYTIDELRKAVQDVIG